MNELLIFKKLKAKGHDTQSIKQYLKMLKEKSESNKNQYNESDKSGIESTYQTIEEKENNILKGKHY